MIATFLTPGPLDACSALADAGNTSAPHVAAVNEATNWTNRCNRMFGFWAIFSVPLVSSKGATFAKRHS